MKRLAIAVLILLLTAGVSFATTAQQVDFLLSGSLDGDGAVNTGGKVYTCDAGTVCGPSTSNPKTTWQDANKAVAHANPIILDSFGRSSVFADGNYKFQIFDSSDVLIETIDNVFYDVSTGTIQAQDTLTPSSQTISTTVGTYYCDATSGDVTTDFSGASAVGNTGKRFTFKKIDSTTNTCTVDVLSSQTIDGSTTAVLAVQYDDITIESDGTNWTEVRGMVFSRTMFVNTISEPTSGTGVTIDSFKIIDNGIAPSSWPSFFVHRDGSNQTNIAGEDVVEFDDDSTAPAFDTNSDYDTTTFKFTPSVAGKYFLKSKIEWSSVTVNDKLEIYIRKNGTRVASEVLQDVPATVFSQQVSVIVDANGTTDFFEAAARNVDRDTSTVNGNVEFSFFTGSRIAQ